MYVLTCVILTNLLKATNFLFQFLDSVTFDDNIFFVKELNYDILPFFFLLFHEEFYVRDYCLGPDSRWLNCVWCHTCNQGTSIMALVTVCNKNTRIYDCVNALVINLRLYHSALLRE